MSRREEFSVLMKKYAKHIMTTKFHSDETMKLNTQHDDKKAFADAARMMVKKLNERLESMKQKNCDEMVEIDNL